MMAELEARTFNACIEFLTDAGQDTIWAMSCCGPRARLWTYDRNAGCLQPFYLSEYDNQSRGKDRYVDFKGAEAEFLEAFDHIKVNAAPVRKSLP